MVTVGAPNAAAGVVLEKIVLTGEPAPGAGEGAVFNALTTGVNHAIMTPRIEANGRIAFSAILGGPGAVPGTRSSIWSYQNGLVELVVRGGNVAPGTPDGVIFSGVPNEYLPVPPVLGGGRLVFPGELTGPGVTYLNAVGSWARDGAQIRLVVRKGDQAPGTAGGVTFSDVWSTLSPGGHALVRGNLIGPGIGASSDEGLWSDRFGALSLIVREGDPVPDLPGLVFSTGQLGAPQPFGETAMASDGRLLVQANLAGPGVTAFNDEAIFVEEFAGGPLRVVVREGQAAPGCNPGVTIGSGSVSLLPRNLRVNANGDVMFHCRIGGSIPTTEVAFSSRFGFLQPIIMPGDPLPDIDVPASYLNGTLLSETGAIAMIAALPDDDGDPFTPPPAGVWWSQPGFLTTAALPGHPVGGGRTLRRAVTLLNITESGFLAFLAELNDPDRPYSSGLVIVTPGGATTAVAAIGDRIDVIGDGSDVREVIRVMPAGVSESGESAVRLDFADWSSGHFLARLGGGFLGDMNCDGIVTPGDIAGFVMALTSPAEYAAVFPDCDAMNGDVNGDGAVTPSDIAGFVALLAGGG